MSIEEKAKAYDEVLKWAKGLLEIVEEDKIEITKDDVKSLFFELRESDDERIRQKLLKCCDSPTFEIQTGIKNEVLKSWLEKHKEQKSIESIAAEVTKDKESAIKFLKSAGIMDDNGELAEMYRSEQKPSEGEWPNLSNCIRNCKKCHGKCLYRKEPYEEQKPAEWSEKDEILRIRTINRLETLNFHGISGKEICESIDWLKSLSPLPKHEWSEEDEKMVEKIDCYLFSAIGVSEEERQNIQKWLKSTRPQLRMVF